MRILSKTDVDTLRLIPPFARAEVAPAIPYFYYQPLLNLGLDLRKIDRSFLDDSVLVGAVRLQEGALVLEIEAPERLQKWVTKAVARIHNECRADQPPGIIQAFCTAKIG